MKLIVIAVAAAGLAAWMAYRPACACQVAGPATHQFRVSVGWRDTAAKEWKGKIEVTGGELARVEGWRFGEDDKANQDGTFAFQTKVANLENQLSSATPFGQTDWQDPRLRRLVPMGLVVQVRGGDSVAVRFTSSAGTFEFANVAMGGSREALDGNARVERLPVETQLSSEGPADDDVSIALTPSGERAAAWLSYESEGDWVVVNDGKRTVRVTEKGDHHSPSLLADQRGWLHVAYAAREKDQFHVWATTRAGETWTTARRMSGEGSSNVWPVLAGEPGGRRALAWQSFRNGQAVIALRQFNGRQWEAEQQASGEKGNAWAPALGFGGGKLWAVWDSYATGAYQIYARSYQGTTAGPIERVTAGAFFSVRPAVAVTAAGVPVVAWEESGNLWGKDYAFLTSRVGATLYQTRRVRVAYLEGGAWKELPSPVDAIPAHMRRFVQQPRLAFDGAGRLHLVVRVRTSANTARMDNWAAGGRWETFLTRLEGSRWTPAIAMPSSVGRNGMRASLAVSGEAVHVGWSTDRRSWPQGRYGDVDVLAARVASSGAASAIRNGTPLAAPAAPANPHPNEDEDVSRIRAYRINVAGKTYRIVRGDLHRHTELSGDGAGDGSLDDLYRYALDAAQMDYAHVADHQMGNDEAYNWWITQKSNDVYHLPGKLVPLYGYERSVRYPNGHRNVIWAERGQPVLRVTPGEQKGEVNTGSLLYPYLKRTDGIATSHTSATEQGTDWRDQDPTVEPFVEIYQGFESSYEHAGAPRAWKEGEKAVHQGPRPAGYVWNAWAKGYKLGVQASSDHVSTHTSFACILVEEFTRKGLLDAMRKRHTYAATDAIVLDYRVNGVAVMGDIIDSPAAPRLEVKVVGTAPLKRIDVIKNNTYVHKAEPNAREASFSYVDTAYSGNENYYYVRVEQADGQMAWSSPIWVRKP